MRFKAKLFTLFVVFITFLLIVLIVFNSYCLNSYEVNEVLKIRHKRLERVKTSLPVIYIITPTHNRLVQKAELLRQSYALLLVKNIHWIIVEDSEVKTQLVTKFIESLRSYGDLNVTHLNVLTPPQYKMKTTDPNWLKPRGVLQRNVGIEWIRDNANSIDRNGVLYFADDDNTYDLKLFDEMRFTRRVSVWPVGLVGGLRVEKPIVRNGKVVSWNTMWKRERHFPTDMSGFAVNINLLLDKPNAYFSLKVGRGSQETFFIEQLVSGIDQLEPKANDCTEILVWHTRTSAPDLKQEKRLKSPSDEGMVF